MDQKFLDILKQTPQMKVKPIKLQDLDPNQWITDLEKGVIRKPDGSFFYISGVSIESKKGLEVSAAKGGYQMPGIFGDGGSVILAIYKGKFVIRPKQEPGYEKLNRALFAAGFQASESNEAQAHGGDKPPGTKINESEYSTTLAEVNQAKDGNRFISKINHHKIIKLDNEPVLEGGAILVSEEDLAHMILGLPMGDKINYSLANEHLVELWARYTAAQKLRLI